MTDEIDEHDPVAVTTSMEVVESRAVWDGQGKDEVKMLVIPEPEHEQKS